MQGRLLLVGDPKQLPPTVISTAAAAGSLACSLFERLQRAAAHTCLLEVQYRMHPGISAFPARFFYAGGLRDGVTAAQKAAMHHRDVRSPLRLACRSVVAAVLIPLIPSTSDQVCFGVV